MYRKLAVLFIIVMMAVSLSCTKKTGITGRLILQTGQTGDVRNCRVQLYVSQDLTGNPVKEVASSATGVDQTKSDFSFEDVVPGYYYLLAWKDLNGDGVVSDRDIVGIDGGTYRPGYGGSQITVTDGKVTDLGDITMLIYKELITTMNATREANQFMDVNYSFNYDVTVTSWMLSVPGGNPAADPTQLGDKTAGTTYTSAGWNAGGNPPASGPYVIAIGGTWEGVAFSITDTVNLAF